MLRKIGPAAIVAFIVFLIATAPDTAATLGAGAASGLGKLASGAADVLTAWVS